MYYDYFGLDQAPFRITPDTRLFFSGAKRGAILEAMQYAVHAGEGIIKVVGEVGSGKTMLCRKLQEEFSDKVEVVYLANPSLAPENTLHAIATELKLDVSLEHDRLKVMNTLQDYLLQAHAEGRQVVVFIEEAQSMPIETLEQIRLLSNLETGQFKLLQMIIFGQPELDEMLNQKSIRQLKERITYTFYLDPLQQEDIKDYLNSRLRACGYRAEEMFSKDAIKAINKFSKGLLRRINILADKAMLAAYADNTTKVTKKHIYSAAADSEFMDSRVRFFLQPHVLGILLCTFVAIFYVFMSGSSLDGVKAVYNKDFSEQQNNHPVLNEIQNIEVEGQLELKLDSELMNM